MDNERDIAMNTQPYAEDLGVTHSDHVGEELVGEPCQAEVTQEHIRQLRQMIVMHQAALLIMQRAMFDLLPNQDARVLDLADLLDVKLPWIT